MNRRMHIVLLVSILVLVGCGNFETGWTGPPAAAAENHAAPVQDHMAARRADELRHL